MLCGSYAAGISVMISIITVMKVRRGAQGASVRRGRQEAGRLGPWRGHKKTPLSRSLGALEVLRVESLAVNSVLIGADCFDQLTPIMGKPINQTLGRFSIG